MLAAAFFLLTCTTAQPMRPLVLSLPSCRCYVFGGDERAALAHKASSYCAKLLKRTDQCQAVLACSHLYWQPQVEVRSLGLDMQRPPGVTSR